MVELYKSIVEKGGTYGILSVVLIILLSLIINKSKNSPDIWLAILKLIRLFLILTSGLLFFQVFDNSNLLKLTTQKEELPIDTSSQTSTVEPQSSQNSNYKLSNPRIELTETNALLLTDDGNLTYIKMEKNPGFFDGGWHENKYSIIPASKVRKIKLTKIIGGGKIVEIEYNLANSSEEFITDERFNETNFTLFVEYGLKKFNKRIFFETEQSYRAVIFYIVFLLLMFYIIYRAFRR